jgi:hypothetical protein
VRQVTPLADTRPDAEAERQPSPVPTKSCEVEAVPVTARLVEVAFVLEEFAIVTFWKVEEAEAVKFTPATSPVEVMLPPLKTVAYKLVDDAVVAKAVVLVAA